MKQESQIQEIKNFKKGLKKQEKKDKNPSTIGWVIKISIVAFTISLLFSFLSESIIPNVSMIFSILIIVIFIGLGILFDMIGVAVTSADEKPFHAMSAKKIRGADIAVIFKKNADKVSSFCNDVIGDICGIISGSAGVYIAISISQLTHFNSFLMSLLTTALIASLTIGGKALGKSFAIHKSTIILYEFSKFISYFYHPKNK